MCNAEEHRRSVLSKNWLRIKKPVSAFSALELLEPLTVLISPPPHRYPWWADKCNNLNSGGCQNGRGSQWFYIRPRERTCWNCHQASRRRAGLRLGNRPGSERYGHPYGSQVGVAFLTWPVAQKAFPAQVVERWRANGENIVCLAMQRMD